MRCLLTRISTRSTNPSILLRSLSSSCHIRASQQSCLNAKSASIADVTGEKWFPNLASPAPSRFIPHEQGQQPVSEPESEEEGPIWRTMSTPDPRKEVAVNDPTRLFRDDGSVTIDPVYLRDSCQCSLCVDPSTRQRKFVTAHIPQDIRAVFQAQSSHGSVRVKWRNDIPGYPADHHSVFSQPYLRSLTSPFRSSLVARKRPYWDRVSFGKRVNWTSYPDFVNDTEAYKAAVSALLRDGLIFITEVDASHEAVGRMAQRLGPLRNTFYGSTWDVRSVPNSKNVAYTNQYLGFHMDLLYMAQPPGYQLLHCLKNSCSGGESRFADAFFAATRFRRDNQRGYRKLCRYPVCWTYENVGQLYVAQRSTFQEVSQFIRGDEMAQRRVAGLINEDTDADLAYVNWSPPFQGRLYHNPKHPERTREFVEAMREFDRILNGEDMVFEIKMEEGTCAIFENRRVVHARNAFKTEDGQRWLRGAYVDEDAFWSTCHTIGAGQYDTTGIELPAERVIRKI